MCKMLDTLYTHCYAPKHVLKPPTHRETLLRKHLRRLFLEAKTERSASLNKKALYLETFVVLCYMLVLSEILCFN